MVSETQTEASGHISMVTVEGRSVVIHRGIFSCSREYFHLILCVAVS